jgi:uncharacterized protein (TIGR02300 family)
VVKSKLGEKRLCAECSAKFYDLNRKPPVCPHCKTVFEIPVPVSPRGRPAPKAPKAPVAPVKVEPEKPAEKVEVISLEEADAETKGEEVSEIDDSDIEDVNTDIGGAQELMDAEDDGDEDVTTIGVDVKKKED